MYAEYLRIWRILFAPVEPDGLTDRERLAMLSKLNWLSERLDL